MNKRLRVLLITYTCSEEAVGEAWSSFQWASRLAQRHEVTVLSLKERNHTPLEEQLSDARVVAWYPRLDGMGAISRSLKSSYVAFCLQVRGWIKRALRRGERFDVIHQISPLALRYPSPGVGLGVPLVMGPLGGSMETPAAFEGEFRKVPWYMRLRGLDRWRLRYDPVLRRTYARADMVLGVAPYVRELLERDGKLPCRRFEVMSETGVVSLPEPARGLDDGVVRLLFVGRLIRSKGVLDAMRAMGQLKDVGNWHFDLVGEGEDRAVYEQAAADLGIRERVTFHGRMPRAQVDDFYMRANVFLFPSFREPSGNAVLEAMSFGLPVVVADRGGPSAAATADCGFKLPVENPAQFAHAITEAVGTLLTDPARRVQMGQASRRRIEERFLWEQKVDRVCTWYEELVGAGQTNVEAAVCSGVG